METQVQSKPSGISRRGFASMTPEKRRAIASLGGKAVQASGKAHRFTPEEARIAGKKGGSSLVARRGTGYMGGIGQKGGSSPGKSAIQA